MSTEYQPPTIKWAKFRPIVIQMTDVQRNFLPSWVISVLWDKPFRVVLAFRRWRIVTSDPLLSGWFLDEMMVEFVDPPEGENDRKNETSSTPTVPPPPDAIVDEMGLPPPSVASAVSPATVKETTEPQSPTLT